MFERLRDTVTEFRGQREFTRAIQAAVAAGDREAAVVFRTGTLAAALTVRSRDARGEEVTAYVRAVIRANGNAKRVAWLRR
ncbi:hypothetical protein AB0442_23055 [Kitasatospora sp. NPDC085895]|uniref:hypothetical protein n=1 Tax=Kitasatospora sp. NPDC085895 TaxID=3155057 RepID=UPI00344D0EA0